jgi:hypothetical protein
MATSKNKPADNGKDKKVELWIKIVPIVLTAIGVFFAIYKGLITPPAVNTLQQETWKKTRDTYGAISDLTTRIIYAKSIGNDSLLQALSADFNSYRLVKLKVVNESKRVNNQMTDLYAILDDAVHHQVDALNPNILEDACRHLADSIRVSITEGDMKYGKPQ